MKLAILDPIRGFAALTVLVYHCIEHFGWKSFPAGWPLVWFKYGWMGVDIFFVLSGLVIGLSTFSRINKGEVGWNLFRNFMRRRLARILPLYFLTLIAFILLVGGRPWDFDLAKDFAAHFILIHNIFGQYHGSINGTNWSVGVELQFYLLFILLSTWLYRTRAIVFVLLAIAVSWAWRFACFIALRNNGDAFQMFHATTQITGLLDEFAIGVLLARIIRTDWFRKLTSAQIWLKLFVLLLAIALFTYSMQIYQALSSYWNYFSMVVMFRSLLGLSFAGLIFSLITLFPRDRIHDSLIPFSYLGVISYGIYLWHLPVILLINSRLVNMQPLQATFLTLVSTLILSVATWHLFEKPILKKFA